MPNTPLKIDADIENKEKELSIESVRTSTFGLSTFNKNDKTEATTTVDQQSGGEKDHESKNEISSDHIVESGSSKMYECDTEARTEEVVRSKLKNKDTDGDKLTEDEEESKEFLKFLELEPPESKIFKKGRTACTITKKLYKPPNFANFGFSICWMNPPRIDGIKPGFPAESCGLKCGDYIIFVDKTNVTMKSQEEVLQLFAEAGSTSYLEIYRPCKDDARNSRRKKKRQAPTRSTSTPLPAISDNIVNENQTRTSVSMDISKKALDLPDLPSVFEDFVGEKGRLGGINQLVNTEKYYIACLQFGIARFMLPLAERKDLCTAKDHSILFQNSPELLRLSEDILEKLNSTLDNDEKKPFAHNVGEIYYNKLTASCVFYRKYCCGLKKSFCVLAAKTRNKAFMKLLNEPPIPRKRPDLVGFLHKPLEHYRLTLKLLQSILNCTAPDSKDYQFLLQVVSQYQLTYKEITVESGLMEPKGEGKPLLTLQDLESRLVFTRCKPFTLETSGRSWIFGGDLTRVEGNITKRFWALLFTDIIVFAKVSRDRVIFITEEPLPLLQIVHAVYNIRKKETDFRLVLSDKPRDVDSPVATSCGNLSLPLFPNVLKRSKHSNYKRHYVRLRAPTVELKAVWQNLINRQVIYLNTGRGTTPIGTPDSQDLFVDWESNPQPLYSSVRQNSITETNRKANDIIEFKCNKLAKMGFKESAIHLSKWMKEEIGSSGTPTPGSELDFDVWSEEALKKRTSEIRAEHEYIFYTSRARNYSRCEVLYFSGNTTPTVQAINDSVNKVEAVVELHERPKSRYSNGFEDEFSNVNASICKNCHDGGHYFSCHNQKERDSQAVNHNVITSNLKNSNNFTSVLMSNCQNKVPHLSVVPPTPPLRQKTAKNVSIIETDLLEKDSSVFSSVVSMPKGSDSSLNKTSMIEEDANEVPYLPLNSKSKLKKFNTRCSLEKIIGNESSEDEYDYESNEDIEQNDADDDEDEVYSDDDLSNDLNQTRIINILSRASSFMGEKFATIEKLVGDDKNVAFTFFDRYLRSKPSDSIKPLPATSTTLGGEDDCETLSGSEVWGTPSGGDSELQSPVSNDYSDEMYDINPLEELLAATQINTVSLRFPPTALKSRLEPLPEDEEESYYSDSLDNCSTNNSSNRNITEEWLEDSSTHTSRSILPNDHSSSPGFFNRLILRRSKSVESPSKDSSKSKFFHSRTKSEDNASTKQNHSKTMPPPSRELFSNSLETQIRQKSFWNHLKIKDKTNKKLK